MTKKKSSKKATPKKPEAQAKPKEPKVEEPKVEETESYLGKEVLIKQGGVEYKGVCICERSVQKHKQVFLKLNGCVSRWFNTEDIVE